MRLVTYRLPDLDADRVGAIVGDAVLDVAGGSLLDLLRAGLERAPATRVPEVRHALGDVELRAPLPRPNSIRDFMLIEEHVRNSFGTVPEEWYELPVYWKGNCEAIYGPGDEVPWPGYTDKLDYELELAAVIGRRTHRVGVETAARSIAGYTIFNDWSARDIQFREMKVGLGPGLGKDFATSLGPCLTTADEIDDVGRLLMRARVNGEVWSEGTLGAMRFTFAEVISHLSEEQVLMPGDVIGSGTVARGCGLELDRWIAPGDLVELEVEGIGVLANRVGVKRAAVTRA